MFKMFLTILSMVLSFSDCKYSTAHTSYDLGSGLQTRNSGAIGVIHFPDAANPGLNLDGPPLAKRPDQHIRSTGGLSNFIESPVEVIVPDSGLTAAAPWNLGTNPMSCCGYPVYTQNVACTGNDNGTAGNDFYYTFTVDSICGSDYPNVVIKTCGTDFGVNTKIKLRDAADTSWTTLNLTKYDSTNCQTENGQVFEMKDLGNTVFFPTLAFKRPFEFLVEVDAQSLSAIGNFKTEIQIQEDYSYETELGPVACELPASCCRMAVNGESENRESLNVPLVKKPLMKLVPNPAKDRLTVQLFGLKQEAILSIYDALGREMLKIEVGEQTELDVISLSKGIYRVRARDSLSTVQKTLIIE